MLLASVTVTKRGYASGLTGKLSSAFKQSAMPAASGLDDLARFLQDLIYTVTSRDLHYYRCCEEAKIEISGTHEVGVLSEWLADRLAAREQRFLAIELDK